ncbi:MAG: anti-sigma factor family protein [Ignavibacteriaceae bacterium]
MKTNDKIIEYLDGQLSEDEKASFENELKTSSILQSEFQQYKKIKDSLSQLRNIEVDESYFIETIPKFRTRQSVLKRYGVVPKLTLGLSTLLAVALVFVVVFSRTNRVIIPTKVVVVDSSGTDFSTLLDPSSDNFNLNYISNNEASRYDSLLNSMITKALDLSPSELSYVAPSNNSDLTSILQNINEKEADNIYNEVLKQKILGR